MSSCGLVDSASEKSMMLGWLAYIRRRSGVVSPLPRRNKGGDNPGGPPALTELEKERPNANVLRERHVDDDLHDGVVSSSRCGRE